MCEALRELMKDEIEEEKRIAVEAATREIREAAAIEVAKAEKEAKEAAAIEVAKAEKEVKKAARETILTDIRSLMENTKWTAEKAMTALNIPAAEHADYAAKL